MDEQDLPSIVHDIATYYYCQNNESGCLNFTDGHYIAAQECQEDGQYFAIEKS